MIFLKKSINKIIIIIILILLISILYLHFTREKEYIKSFDNGTKIIKIYSNKNIKSIYQKIEEENNNDKIKKILNKNGVDKFILNNNGNITAGKHYSNEKYLVSLIYDDKIEDIVQLENESMYIYEKDNFFVVAINDTLKKAEEDVVDYLSSKKLNEDKSVYVIDEDKNMTINFKKHIK